jgi:vacuolar-type H+-ATPase subunit H
MSEEGIRKLVQCENKAKERLNSARREHEQMKAQALRDAMEVVEELRRRNNERLGELEREVEEYIRTVEEKLRAENEARVEELRNVKNREKIIEALVHRVAGGK